jgi:hypothetical protein
MVINWEIPLRKVFGVSSLPPFTQFAQPMDAEETLESPKLKRFQ